MRIHISFICIILYLAFLLAPVAVIAPVEAIKETQSDKAVVKPLVADTSQKVSQNQEIVKTEGEIKADSEIQDKQILTNIPADTPQSEISNSFFDASAFLRQLEKNPSVITRKKLLPKPQSYSINETRVIKAINFSIPGYPPTYYDVPSTLRAAGSHALIWVEDNEWGTNVTQADVDHLVDEFDNKIYSLATQFFGLPADIDNDGAINVSIALLELDEAGAAGYFSSHAELQNSFEIFFLDSEAGNDSLFLDSTMMHEFQHMIHHAADPNEDVWINEGCSVFAEYLGAYLLANRDWTLPYFEADPDTSLIFWDYYEDDHPVEINYAMSYLFINYLSENYGGSSAISKLVQNDTYQGIQGIEEIVLKPWGKTFEEVFIDWIMANYFDNPSFDELGYQEVDVYTKEQGTIILDESNVSVSISSQADYRAGHVYLLKDFNGTIEISFDGLNSGDFNVSIVEHNRLKNAISFLPLDGNQDGMLSVPMYNSLYLFVINQKGTAGGYWDDQTITDSSYALTATLVPSTVSIGNAAVSIDESSHTLNHTGITISNQTATWTNADLVGLEIYDADGNSAQLAFELTYDPQASSWEIRNATIKALPAGQYYCRIFAKNGLEGGTTDSSLFTIRDSLEYWQTWVNDPDEGLTPEIELYNVSYHTEGSNFLVKLGLEGQPALDSSHEYRFSIDLDCDSSYEWLAWYEKGLTAVVDSYWYRASDGWYTSNIHYVLGNNLLFKLPLREFAIISEMDVRVLASNGTSTDDTPYQTVTLTMPHSLPSPTVIYPNGGEVLNGTVLIQWTNVSDSLGHAVTFAVYYAANSSAPWTQLALGLINTSYSWNTTSVADGTSYLIKIVATCSNGLTSEDSSDFGFAIENLHELMPPTIISPNGGETLSGTVIIQWMNVTDPLGHAVTYAVYYSNKYGVLWTQLALGLTTTSYFWDTTIAPDGASYFIKVEAICSEGITSEDTSDASFTIQNADVPPSSSTSTALSAMTQSKDGESSALSPGFTISILIASFSLLIFWKLRKQRDFS
ncbi:MAG: hypothetical protein ACFFGZ_04415 [Candidatus Thorarchaeota archaeon]